MNGHTNVATGIPARIGTNMDETGLSVANGAHITKFAVGSATYDPPSRADGEVATTTVSVSDAAVSDHAIASFSTAMNYQWLLESHVQSGGTVRVNMMNKTGSTEDLASGTLKVTTIRTQ